jgi:hypothetical protein
MLQSGTACERMSGTPNRSTQEREYTCRPLCAASDLRAKFGEASCDATTKPMRAQPLTQWRAKYTKDFKRQTRDRRTEDLGLIARFTPGLRCKGRTR